jgi:hypothetical protein
MSEPGFASLGPTLLARKGGAKPAMRPQLAPLVQDEQKLAEVAEDQLEDLGWNDMGDSEPAAGGADIVPINADVAADHIMQGPGPIVRRQQRRLEERVLADAVMTGPDDEEPDDEAEDEVAYRAPYDAAEDFGAEDYEAEDYAEDDYEAEDYGSADYGAENEEEEDDSAPFASAPHYAPLAAAPVRAPRKVQALAAEPASRPRPAPRAPVVQASRRAAFTLRLDADRHLKLRLAATMQGVSAQALLTEALDAMLASFDDLDVIANHLKRH